MPTVSSPASSGNLGPGFDAFALSLELRCEVVAQLADRWSVEHVGPHRPPLGAHDLVLAAAQKAVGDLPLRLVVANDIPLSRGLGSSSAAAAAGAAAAMAAAEGTIDSRRVFDLVTEFEGHADNAAAAVYGGLIAIDGRGEPLFLEVSKVWKVLIAVPGTDLPTSEARAALSPTIERSAVVRNLGRVTALIEGLRSGDESMLRRAGGDELHQLDRAHLHPRANILIDGCLAAGGAHAAWSGAGPSVIAFVTSRTVEAVRTALEQGLEGTGTVMELELADQGLLLAS